jgi:hypothetical protein
MPYQACWYWLFSFAIGSVNINLKVNIINISLRYLALTIRNLNYTLNFFLYSLTSIVFLKEAFTIAHCNYFLNQSYVERNHAFRRVRRLFSDHGVMEEREQQEQQQSGVLIDRTNPNHEQQMNYSSFKQKKSKLRHSKKTSNGHLNHSPNINNVSLNLKPISLEKKLKWNLKVSHRTLSDNHLDYLKPNDEHQQSSNHTSASNILEINNKVQQ